MKKEKTQIFFIHGGMTFKKREDYLNYLRNRPIRIEKKTSWTDYVEKKLKRKFDIIRPRFPLFENARYEDWKIYFERFFPFFRDNIILVGNSLGAIFLAKYLSENKFPKKILATYLVCPPYDNTLEGEDLVGGFELGSNLSKIEKNSKSVNLLFSENDEVVPLSHAKKYENRLKRSNFIFYEDMNGHFRIEKFPHIVKMIKTDLRNKS